MWHPCWPALLQGQRRRNSNSRGRSSTDLPLCYWVLLGLCIPNIPSILLVPPFQSSLWPPCSKSSPSVWAALLSCLVISDTANQTCSTATVHGEIKISDGHSVWYIRDAVCTLHTILCNRATLCLWSDIGLSSGPPKVSY
jgi:hypothetical protein